MIDNTFIQSPEYQDYLDNKEEISKESVVFVEDKERLITLDKEYQFVPSEGQEGQILYKTEDGVEWQDTKVTDLSDYYTKEEINDKIDKELYEINANGYDYVDLGLPSGTLWSKCNIGASSPEKSGLYFAFGETKGYTEEQVKSGERTFSLDDYLFKDTLLKVTITPENDAAIANMGGDWHMPTLTDYKELADNCTLESIYNFESTNVLGVLFTSKINGNSIFIPLIFNNTGTLTNPGPWANGVYGPISTVSLGACLELAGLFNDNSSTYVTSYSNKYVGRNIRAILSKSEKYLPKKEAEETYQPLLPEGNEGEILVKTETGVEWQLNTIIREGENGPIVTELIIDDLKNDESLLTKEAADTLYQPKFNVGNGLELEDNTLNITLDTTIFKVVESLPTLPATGDENKLHLVLSETSETGNLYEEYLYIDNEWELLGKFKAEIDLTPYLKIEKLDEEATKLGYAKSEDVTAEIEEAVGDMATMTWVNEQEYLTLHLSLENYYTKTQTDSAIESAFDWAEY